MSKGARQTDERLPELGGPIRLTVERKIAGGGMGVVYQATQHGVEGFAKTVAVKIIRDQFSRSREFTQMFIGEAKLVADLVHQNIAQVYHLGRSGTTLYIVMEYVDGISLGEFMQRHRDGELRIPVDLAAYIASRICRGLEYAHEKIGPRGNPLKVVHRDVSPNNIMLTSLGEIKILDFGVAKARKLMVNREREGLIGKYHYMSPEQAELQSTDKRSDLFSLGIVLWEMLAGRKPFPEATSPTDWLNRIRSTSMPSIAEHAEGVPEALEAIVTRALQRDPCKRYQHAGKMGYDLEYFMYHKGYGPTIVTMAGYLRETFSDLSPFSSGSDSDSEQTLPDTIILDRPPDEESRA